MRALLVARVQQLNDELLVLLERLEVSAAAQRQRHVEHLLEMTMRAFDVAVFVRAPDVGCAPLQLVVLKQTFETSVEYTFGSFPMRYRTAVVELQPGRQPAEPIRRLAQRLMQRVKRFALADHRPFDVGKRQHSMAEEMRERLVGDKHPELMSAHPVDLQPLARFVYLLEEQLFGHVLGAVVAKAPLQGAKHPVVEALRILAFEKIQRHRRRQISAHLEHVEKILAHIGERINSCTPGVRHANLRRQQAQDDVLARRRRAHTNFHGTSRLVPGGAVLVEEPSNLSVVNQPP